MERPLKILLLEDSTTDAELIQRFLLKEKLNCEFRLAMNRAGFLEALDNYSPGIILSDNSLPGFNATEALKIVRGRFQHLPFILITGTVSEEYAAQIIKQGADDYILKDRLARLPAAIETALNQRRMIAEREKMQSQLIEREAQLELFIEHSPASLAMFDNEMSYIAASLRWANDYHLERQQLVGKSHYEIFPEVTQRWKDIHQRCLRGAIEKSEKDLFIRADGSSSWLRWEIHPWHKASGEIGGIIIFTEDITERKKAVEDILENQARLNQAQQIAHLGSWDINFATNTSNWSDEAYRIYGLTPGDHNLSIEEWMSFVHPEDLDNVKKIIDDSYVTLKDIAFHHRIIRKDGAVRHIYSESKFEFGPGGKPIGLYGIAHDVTESKDAEEEIRKSNERFEYAIRASSDIIWELNFETRQYLVHEGKEKLFGFHTELNWQLGIEGNYIHEEDRERVRKSFGDARKDPFRTLWENEYKVHSTENTVMHIVNHGIFIRDEKGKAIRAIGAITDITEKKKLEADLLEQQKQEQIKITVTAMEAQEKERTAIGQELHDNVNQILVAANMKLAMTKNNPEKTGEMIATTMTYLQQAIAENRKIAHVFVAPDLETENLADQLQRLVHNMLGTAGMETYIITNGFREETLDSARKINIYRIAQEQCTNIIKYAKATTVRLELSTSGDVFKMLIADNGVGMDESKKSTGIGLRNINGRLSLFNGSSHIITAPGKGFTLEISMPLGEK